MIQTLTKIIYFIPVALTWLCLMGLPHDLKSWLFFSGSIVIVFFLSLYLKLFPEKIRLSISSISYFFWLIKEIYKSAFNVILIIWRRKLKISPTLEWIESNKKDALSIVVFANSITLTPGTVSVDIKGSKILVHALEKKLLESL